MGRSEFYTSYTPYQPEVSQGTLQYSFEFQSLVCDLFEMDVANSSVYDGASASAEAVLMALRIARRDRVVLDGSVHPEYRSVVSYLDGRGIDIVTSEVGLRPTARSAPADGRPDRREDGLRGGPAAGLLRHDPRPRPARRECRTRRARCWSTSSATGLARAAEDAPAAGAPTSPSARARGSGCRCSSAGRASA